MLETINDLPTPAWVALASGQHFPRSLPPPLPALCSLVSSSVVGFVTSHFCDQLCEAREGITVHSSSQSASHQTLECLLCARHCVWCWDMTLNTQSLEGKTFQAKIPDKEHRSRGYKGVEASGSLVRELASGHDFVQVPAWEEEKRRGVPSNPATPSGGGGAAGCQPHLLRGPRHHCP